MLLAFVIEKRSFENITKLNIKDQKPEGKKKKNAHFVLKPRNFFQPTS